MSKFKQAWESYKRDYPNRKTREVKVKESKEKICFLDYHNGIAYCVCLTKDNYTMEKIPDTIKLI